jgi:hypothetical protein
MTLATLGTWHELVRTRNTKGLNSVLADEVVFYSPIVHTPQVGKTIALRYLSAAFHVFSNTASRGPVNSLTYRIVSAAKAVMNG